IKASPFVFDAVEDRLHLPGAIHVQRHHDRRIKFARQRFDERLRLVVEISDGELGTQASKRFGTTPRDRLIVCDSHDETTLAFQERRLREMNRHADLLYSTSRRCLGKISSKVWVAIISSSLVGTT